VTHITAYLGNGTCAYGRQSDCRAAIPTENTAFNAATQRRGNENARAGWGWRGLVSLTLRLWRKYRDTMIAPGD
jgi:hypothetical protein